MIDSISAILDNSGYTPEYLKTCYAIEFYQILRYIKQKLERQNKK